MPQGAICISGLSGIWLATTEIYDGSAWSASDKMSTARYYLAGGGGPSGAISMGGNPGGYSGANETFTTVHPVVRTNVIWI